MPRSEQNRRVWLIDGFNVIHNALLGGRDRSNWWTEPRRRELIERAAGFDDLVNGASELWIVFDGERPAANPEAETAGPAGWPRCVFAPSADTWLVDRVRRDEEPDRLRVVTADRQVADRARHRGAQILSPRAFLARCAVPRDGARDRQEG
jgi:predicted RNA-binding protein with PIN domain